MRKEPSDRSEMVNQVLFGETMTVLEVTDKWTLVRLDHDQYEGWVDRKQISVVTKETMLLGNIQYVSDLFAKYKNEKSEMILPAGSVIGLEAPNYGSETIFSSSLKQIAYMFLESPYLWGGRTFMGIDCSGFTQVVFRLVGIILPRDAYQQAEEGEPVMFVEESRTGDLAFFENADGKITHVGIIIKEKEDIAHIIHASGKVRLDKIDHQGIFNEESGNYTHSLRIIKRQLK